MSGVIESTGALIVKDQCKETSLYFGDLVSVWFPKGSKQAGAEEEMLDRVGWQMFY